MLNAALPKRFLSKSKLSTYLRTQCDRHLYLSLFSNKPDDLEAAGIPIPLKTRPNVQLVTKSGNDFEIEQFDTLLRAIPQHVVYNGNYAPIDLLQALSSPLTLPTFILQPAIQPESFRNMALSNLELTTSEQALIPELSGLRPDVLFVRKPFPYEYEILPDGTRRQIGPNETRLAVSVIDLKNVTEANASYAAEVCLYTFFLVNWLQTEGASLKDKYFISDQIYLWKHNEMPNFEQMLSLKGGAIPEKRIEALMIDLKEGLVDYLIYMPSVKKFFKEDVPRVIKKGDTEGWVKVDYHVSSKCGACDWLGNKDWLYGDDLNRFQANPEHYCLHSADVSDHLSKMSNLTKGASHILTKHGHNKISDIIGIPINDPVLKKHSILKRDKSQLGERALALNTGNATIDGTIRIAGLAKQRNAEYHIVVNFDAGAGLLTGIAIRGILFPPYGQQFQMPDGTTKNFHSFNEEAFVVNKDFLDAEWVALQGFIEKLSSWAIEAQRLFDTHGWGPVSSQICFWEARQYEELSNAFGRHLIDVLQLSDRYAKALAWLFPAEELMERDQQLAPGIVFIKDVIDIATRLPVKFANTLLGVADEYHHPNMAPRQIDTYYKEPLGNAIPRERIFEIWKSATGVIRMYGKKVSIQDAIAKYGDVLKKHTWALSSVTARLRSDLGSRLQGTAPILNLSIPSGATGVAYDSKLWLQWNRVEAGTAKTEIKSNLITKAERLEASYKAIVLTRLNSSLGSFRYEFEVSEESTEAKLDEGRYYTLGLVNTPGFPMQTPASLGIQANPPDIEKHVIWQLYDVKESGPDVVVC